MDRIWAPWRLEYYRTKSCSDGCVFCIGDDLSRDRERYVLRRERTAYVMLNKFPFAGGHLLINPYRHIADVTELSREEAMEIHALTSACCNVLRHLLGAEGFNIGVNLGVDGGAGICEHYHQHLVPRWRGDTNYMPLLADVRVLPQHLDETFDLLQPALAAEPLSL